MLKEVMITNVEAVRLHIPSCSWYESLAYRSLCKWFKINDGRQGSQEQGAHVTFQIRAIYTCPLCHGLGTYACVANDGYAILRGENKSFSHSVADEGPSFHPLFYTCQKNERNVSVCLLSCSRFPLTCSYGWMLCHPSYILCTSHHRLCIRKDRAVGRRDSIVRRTIRRKASLYTQ